MKPLSARIPASMFERVQAARALKGETHEAWFLRVLDAVVDQLAALYKPQASRRFARSAPRTRRAHTEVLAQYALRLSPEERAEFDKLVAELGPPSLSHLVTEVVRLGLDHDAAEAPMGSTDGR